jgi:hypothetical protein
MNSSLQTHCQYPRWDERGVCCQLNVAIPNSNQGTLHRESSKKKNQEKWVHSKYKGWINLQKCLGGVTVAIVQSKVPDSEFQILSSFVGFLDRHFRDEIASINLSYSRDNQ